METDANVQIEGALDVAEAVIEGLQREREALVDLRDRFSDQLEAVRTHDLDEVERTTLAAHEAMSRLEQLRRRRERKMRLLARMLQLEEKPTLLQVAAALDGCADEGRPVADELRTMRRLVTEQADQTRRRCDELDFVLHYVEHLSREMLDALRGREADSSAHVYTAAGKTGRASGPSSFVNKVG